MKFKLFGGEGARFSDLDDMMLGRPAGMRAGKWPEATTAELDTAAIVAELNKDGQLGFELNTTSPNGLVEDFKPGPEGPAVA